MGSLALANLPDWPAAMEHDLALAYTRVSKDQMRAWEKARKVHFVARGPNGMKVALRSELDAALIDLFATSDAEDFDFGDD